VADLAGFEFDRDRSFAPTVLIVIASYYVLFAVHGGSSQALVVESVAAGGFMLLLFWGVIRGQGCVLLKKYRIHASPRISPNNSRVSVWFRRPGVCIP
jgi:hypothetical protein